MRPYLSLLADEPFNFCERAAVSTKSDEAISWGYRFTSLRAMSTIHINSFAEAFLGSAFIETIADADLRSSPIAGHGLFTLRDRAPGELLCLLDGQLMD